MFGLILTINDVIYIQKFFLINNKDKLSTANVEIFAIDEVDELLEADKNYNLMKEVVESFQSSKNFKLIALSATLNKKTRNFFYFAIYNDVNLPNSMPKTYFFRKSGEILPNMFTLVMQG